MTHGRVPSQRIWKVMGILVALGVVALIATLSFPVAARDPIVVELWVSELASPLIDKFNSQSDTVKAQIVGIGSLARPDQILVAIAGGKTPDIVWGNSRWNLDLIAAGAYVDLTPMAQRSKMPLNDFYPVALNQNIVDGKLYGLPLEVQYTTTYYNQVLLDRAGIAPIKSHLTWQEYKDVLTAIRPILQSTDQYPSFPASAWHALGVAGPFVEQAGGWGFDPVRKMLLINEQAFTKAHEFGLNLIQQGLVAIRGIHYQANVAELFLRGRTAFHMDLSNRRYAIVNEPEYQNFRALPSLRADADSSPAEWFNHRTLNILKPKFRRGVSRQVG
jgi:ABC-type glycerol-3-phosphate transport system substrate-binding protein